jgi:hypothetical protein
MLSLHGLVIVAGDTQGQVSIKETPAKFGSYLGLLVASDNGKGSTTRHYLNLIVGKDKVEEAKAKLTHGTVCEITHATWTELPSLLPATATGEAPSRVSINCEYKNLKILKIPFYYAKIEGVTSEIQETIPEGEKVQ